MRILGFSKKWGKLHLGLPVRLRPLFTTFRFARKDKDWGKGEVVMVVFKPRRKGGGEDLGICEIISKEPRAMAWHGDQTGTIKITPEEAITDGFKSYFEMWEFLWDYYGGERLMTEPINKLTLRWI